MDDGEKIDGGMWRADMWGTTVGGNAKDMRRDAAERRDDGDNKKDVIGG